MTAVRRHSTHTHASLQRGELAPHVVVEHHSDVIAENIGPTERISAVVGAQPENNKLTRPLRFVMLILQSRPIFAQDKARHQQLIHQSKGKKHRLPCKRDR